MTDERESQVIEASDVGVIDLSEETVEPSESVPESEVETVADIECGKLEGKVRDRFLSLYELLKTFGDVIDHSSASRRHHFKVGRRGYALLMYPKTPILWLCYVKEGVKKKQFTKYKIGEKSTVDEDGNSITNKEIIRIVKAYKKARGL